MFNRQLRGQIQDLEEQIIKNQITHARLRSDFEMLLQHLGLKFEDVPARHEIVVGPYKKK